MSGQMTKVFVADARRRWSEDEKQAIIEESRTNPVARVAKKHGVAVSLLFRWRKMQGIRVRNRTPRTSEERTFVPVVVPGAAEPASARGSDNIEIVLACGARLLVGEGTDLALLKRVVAALR
jgi:transposase